MRNEAYRSNSPKSSFTLTLLSFFFLIAEAIGIIGLTVYLLIIDMLPMSYLAGIAGTMAIIWLVQYVFLHKGRTVVTAKRIFNILLSLLFISGIVTVLWYLGGFISVFNAISSLKEQQDIYTVRVLSSSSMDDISDIKGKTIGISSLTDQEDVTKCIEDLTNKLGNKPNTKSYDDDDSLAAALLNDDIDVILFDEAVLSTVEENREGFTGSTRVLHEIKITVEKESSSTKRENIDVTKDTFNIFITGMDSSGKIASRGNSDVNILATVNPKEKKILLTTTPRDYYVPLEGNTSKYDKLTHAGNYGVQCSMDTISFLYDTPIDFYVKVNFSSVEGLVDALGGITVQSDMAFSATTRSGSRVSFSKGTNRLNGAQALAYSRERKSIASGDRARGKHQQQVITGIIDKMTSSSMLKNYNKVLNVISKNTVTDLTTDQMTELIKEQLKNPSSWKTESISVDGTGTRRLTYSYKKSQVYVMIPDQNTVSAAKAKIAQYMKN